MFGKIVESDEIKHAVFFIESYKAPTIDGLQACLYKSQWEIIGDSFCQTIKDVFTDNT